MRPTNLGLTFQIHPGDDDARAWLVLRNPAGVPSMCTSLGYKDAAGKAYFGRTLELTMDLPYQIVFFLPDP